MTVIEVNLSKDCETDPKEDTEAKAGAKANGHGCGLCRLLIVQVMFGITYGGNCPQPLADLLGTNYMTKKRLLIIYDWLIVLSFGVFEYFAFNKDVFNRLFSRAEDKGVMCILFKMGALSMAVDFLVIKFMLLRYGWNTIKAIKSRGCGFTFSSSEVIV